jgi:hypothetical protein
MVSILAFDEGGHSQFVADPQPAATVTLSAIVISSYFGPRRRGR